MSVAQGLTLARESADLGEAYEGLGDVDWLRASGMVARRYSTALDVWRLIEQRDGRALQPAITGMLAFVKRLGIEHNQIETVSRVLQWMAHPKCKTCQGRKFQLLHGTPHLSDKACPDCEGTGLAPREGWEDPEHALYDLLRSEQRAAAGAIGRRLKQD